jgi:hypothetical protein
MLYVNRPTGYQCMQYTAKELIERWGKFHADITVSPLPKHKYTIEIMRHDGMTATWNFAEVGVMLYAARNAKRMYKAACVLVISRDGNFFTAKEV